MTTINYQPDHLSGCCEWLRRQIDNDRYTHLLCRGDVFNVEIMPLFADFPFIWKCTLGFLLFNYQAEWPIQMLSVNDKLDYNSFISLN